jgi:hypothetical protein
MPRGTGAAGGAGAGDLVSRSQATVARLEAMVGISPVPFASEMQPPAAHHLDALQGLVPRLEALANARGA